MKIEERLTECADWVWQGEDDKYGVPAAARMLREAAEVIAEMRAALEAWERYHDVQHYTAYIEAIDRTRAALERAGRGDDGNE